MVNYKAFRLPGNAKLRVRSDNIIATVSSKDKNSVDLYVAGIATPFHIPVNPNKAPYEDDISPKELMDRIWERSKHEDDLDE